MYFKWYFILYNFFFKCLFSLYNVQWYFIGSKSLNNTALQKPGGGGWGEIPPPPRFWLFAIVDLLPIDNDNEKKRKYSRNI